MQRIKKGDEVVVLAGRDKGKRGTVLRRVDAEHVVIEGVNRVKKHQRPNPMKNVSGGIVDLDMPIHVSNVALFNPATKKAGRVGAKTLQDGRKVRVFKANGEPADHIPEAARGILGRSTPELRRMIKQFLMRALTSL